MEETELIWLIIQVAMLKILFVQAKPLSKIIPANFLFDAKYVNSLILSARLEADAGWAGKTYTKFEV